jgi:hypothetical protein
MSVLLQVDFPFKGPWGDDMANAMEGLAQDISTEPGLIWKIWTENPETERAGGVYLFDSPQAAQAYATKHLARLGTFGITGIVAQHFTVNAPLSRITRHA